MEYKFNIVGNSESESVDQNNSTLLHTEKSSLNALNDTQSLEIKNQIEREKDLLYDDKIFGVDIKNKSPIMIGKVFAFLYFKKVPLIIIGPDCNFVLIRHAYSMPLFFCKYNKFFIIYVHLSKS